jgi:RNA polymerase sigma-70 factor (ECF subfamily)
VPKDTNVEETANRTSCGDPGSEASQDQDLLRRMLSGDEEAFAALFRRQQAGVYRFALHMCGSPAVAEDVTQEVFLILMKTGSRYDPSRASVRAFLYGIARNCVKHHQERGGRYVPIPDGDAGIAGGTLGRAARGTKGNPYNPANAPDNPLSALSRSEQIESVRQAVLLLPAPYREAVVLCELQEMSYAEAAAAAGCSLGTIRSRLHRARAILAQKLERQLEGNQDRSLVPGIRGVPGKPAPKRCPA